MSSRTVALVAGTALVVLVAGAVRLAAADPLAGPEQAASARAHPSRAPAAPAAAAPSAAVPSGQWTARKRTGVSAGVLVRAASRKPLDRGATCPPQDAQPTRETTAACASGSPRGEPIEIDWHGERAAP